MLIYRGNGNWEFVGRTPAFFNPPPPASRLPKHLPDGTVRTALERSDTTVPGVITDAWNAMSVTNQRQVFDKVMNGLQALPDVKVPL